MLCDFIITFKVWKRWVDSSKAKNEQAQGRLQLLIKALLLRRTKDQKVEGSDTPLVAMPSRSTFILVFRSRFCVMLDFDFICFREVHVHQVQLSKEENEVYQKLLAFSRKALEEYIKGQEARVREGFTYDRTVHHQSYKPCLKSSCCFFLVTRIFLNCLRRT